MAENSYDSELIGWADEPKRDQEGNVRAWKVALSATNLKDLEQFQTEKGYVYLTLFTSKSGKAMCSVYNPKSAKAQEAASATKGKAKVADDLPF